MLGDGVANIRSRVALAWGLLLAAAGGCAPSSSAPPYALEARLGAYDDGSGRIGLAILATLRDEAGTGPSAEWTLDVRDAAGARVAQFTYDASGPGSYVASWQPAVTPSSGGYSVTASSSDGAVTSSTTIVDATPLQLPVPALTADGSHVTWNAVAGAVAYACRAYAGGLLQLETFASTTGCNLGALPPGAYEVSVLALSADVTSLASSVEARPSIGGDFRVSEATIGVIVGGTSPMQLRAAGGAYDVGVGDRALAVWLSIANADGSATTEKWTVDVVGPNLPASAPLEITYWANCPRLMAWAPAVPAAPGAYTATATSASGAVAQVGFTVDAPAWLDLPLGLTAASGAQGAASASWQPVADARAYLATAYDATTGAQVASEWVSGTTADFPAGTFAPGGAYDVYVAATDADMVFGAIPTQVAVADNVFDHASFVAR